MNTRVSKASATALLVIMLAVGISPSAYAATRGDDPSGSVGDRIVRFVRDIRHFFNPHSEEYAAPPRS